MKQYDLGVIIDHPNLLFHNKFAIIIEDFYPEYYMVELWTFELNNEVQIISLLPKQLRLATERERLIFQKQFEEYCDRNQK